MSKSNTKNQNKSKKLGASVCGGDRPTGIIPPPESDKAKEKPKKK